MYCGSTLQKFGGAPAPWLHRERPPPWFNIHDQIFDPLPNMPPNPQYITGPGFNHLILIVVSQILSG